MPNDNLALVVLTDLLQQLFFASCHSTGCCPRLITARTRSMVEDQQSWLRFVRNLG